MNGLQLYQKYTALGRSAGWNSGEQAYAQTLDEVFWLIGCTRLFDLLEEAEATNQWIAVTYLPTFPGQHPSLNSFTIQLNCRQSEIPTPGTLPLYKWLVRLPWW